MSSVNLFSLYLVFLAFSTSIANALSDEDEPKLSISLFTKLFFLTENDYKEMITCKSFGETDYFLFSCPHWALVYFLPSETFYKITFFTPHDFNTTTTRAKYYRESNSLIIAFQRGTWIAFIKLRSNNINTIKSAQFSLGLERRILDFFIWREFIFVKGAKGTYYLTELKEIFESNSSLFHGRACKMVDSVRANSFKQENLVIASDKVMFYSVQDRALIVNTLSNDALNISSTIYLIKSTELDPLCNETMDISANSDGKLISINCGKGLLSFIYNIDPFNLVEIVENTDRNDSDNNAIRTRFSGFLDADTLIKGINLSSELFYAIEISKYRSPRIAQTVRITWKRFYSIFEPSHVLSLQPETPKTIFTTEDRNDFAILQDKEKDGFRIIYATKTNMTHRLLTFGIDRFPTGLTINQKFIQLDDKYCLSINHSFCFPTNYSLLGTSANRLNSSNCTSCLVSSKSDIDRCIDNYWEIACDPSLSKVVYEVPSDIKSTAISPRKEEICMELARVAKEHRSKYFLNDEFTKSCQKNPKFFVSAAYNADCWPKITDLSYSGYIKAIKVESHGALPQHCTFGFNTDPDQNILIIFDEFEYGLDGARSPGSITFLAHSHLQDETGRIPSEHPEQTANVIMFCASANYLNVEYLYIARFKFIIIKMPASKEITQQFECLGCVSPRKKCYPMINGNCMDSQGSYFRAWTPEKGCFWMDSKSPGGLTLMPQAKASFLSCPNTVNTNFCSKNQMNEQSGEILINAEDYIFPLCRQTFIFEKASGVEIQAHIQAYEMLYVIVDKQIVFFKNNFSDLDLAVLVQSDGQNLNLEVVFFTMDVASTADSLINTTKIFLRVLDSFSSRAMKEIFDLMLFSLKLFILLVVLSNLCVYCIFRRQEARLDASQLELEDVQNPYAKIGFENKHELSIQLSREQILELEAMGINIDLSGNKVDKTEAECALCLEKIELRPHQLYLCGRHYVHIDCFKEWLDKSREQGSVDLCPMRCRTVALEAEPAVRSVDECESQDATGINSIISISLRVSEFLENSLIHITSQA